MNNKNKQIEADKIIHKILRNRAGDESKAVRDKFISTTGIGKSRSYFEVNLGLASMLKQIREIEDKEAFIKNHIASAVLYEPNPIKKTSIPKFIDLALRVVSPFCPVCGDMAKDNRYKHGSSGPSLFTRRYTDFSITRECRCGLRFNFTWRSFVRVMKKKVETESNEEMRTCFRIWIRLVEIYFGLDSPGALAKVEALRQRSRKPALAISEK